MQKPMYNGRYKDNRCVNRFRAQRRRRGFTIAELIVSASVMAVVTGGLTSAIVISSRAIDDGTAPTTITAESADIVGQIASEINFALQFSELTNKSIMFTVPDRDSDGVPEKIRYAWSGTAGDPLTRELNGSAAVNIVEEVDSFGVEHLVRTLHPLPQACCNAGLCTDEPMEDCVGANGEAMGPETDCGTVTCPSGMKVLLVVSDDVNPTASELDHKTLIESLDFAVMLIDDDSTQAEFDAALAVVDAAYASGTASSGAVNTKLRATTVGVLSSDIGLCDEFGIAEVLNYVKRDSLGISIIDNTHYVTSDFSLGTLTIYSYAQPVWTLGGAFAPDLQTLAETESSGSSYLPGLALLETGAELYGGGFAAGRRVQVPWSEGAFDINGLNADGKTIMKRAIEWCAGMEDGGGATICGDSNCDAGEDGCTCAADCGPAPAFEQPGSTCNDGLDNDCDGVTDCMDLNCSSDPACLCGNGFCEPGEDCYTCSSDCASVTSGSPKNQYCCGNGVLEKAEGDGTICHGNP